jgi:mono/diheme cytochrome c family protein
MRVKRRLVGWSHIVAAVFFLTTLWFAFPTIKNVVLPPEITAVQRGQVLADQLGCFRCHGPDGKGGVPNPGSQDETVPGFQGGMLVMYAHDDQEIREYILDGMPASRRNDREYLAQIEKQALRMPTYRGAVSAEEVADLVVYVKAASAFVSPSPGTPEARGMDIAYRNGCLSCHNVMGAGGLKNPGSLKGYIPGWWGEDFDELVRDEAELREWIEEGKLKRLVEHPIARHFVEGQRVQMPAYKKFLKPEEITELIRFVQWVRKEHGKIAGSS